MDGKITFDSLASLALFLQSFVGCTAKFEVNKVGNDYILTFTGGF